MVGLLEEITGRDQGGTLLPPLTDRLYPPAMFAHTSVGNKGSGGHGERRSGLPTDHSEPERPNCRLRPFLRTLPLPKPQM